VRDDLHSPDAAECRIPEVRRRIGEHDRTAEVRDRTALQSPGTAGGESGHPLPAATQWEMVEDSADEIEPAQDEMIRQAAQGQIFHNDDTTMKVLALARPPGEPTGSGRSARTGVFTSGIVSILGGHRIALFFTGTAMRGRTSRRY